MSLRRLSLPAFLALTSDGCLLYKAAVKHAAPRTWKLVLALAITLVCTYRIDYHWGAVFGLGLLVLALCKESPIANRLFGDKAALWLRNISFSLYLSHWPLIQISQWASSWVSLSKNVQAAILVAAIVLCAMALYHFVEVPSRRYLRQKMKTRHMPSSMDATPLTRAAR